MRLLFIMIFSFACRSAVAPVALQDVDAVVEVNSGLAPWIGTYNGQCTTINGAGEQLNEFAIELQISILQQSPRIYRWRSVADFPGQGEIVKDYRVLATNNVTRWIVDEGENQQIAAHLEGESFIQTFHFGGADLYTANYFLTGDGLRFEFSTFQFPNANTQIRAGLITSKQVCDYVRVEI